MKKILFSLLFVIIFSSMVSAQNEYTNAIMPKLPSAFNIFIGREGNRQLPQYIKPDYIRDDYKRVLPNLKTQTNLKFYEKYPIEFHMTTLFSYAILANTFNMRNTFATLGETFHNDYIAFTAFITAYGYFDVHDPTKDYGYIRGNGGIYDGGVQAIFVERILVSARGRANYDINTETFLLMPHYYDPDKNPADFDTPDYYIPQVLNGPGIRVGFIGNYYELAYSQGDYRHSIPKALLFRFNIPNIEFRLLYEHENRRDPKSYHISLFDSLVQASTVFRFPLMAETIWINAVFEYTWREGDAQYIRFEQGFEWYMLNIALREMIYIKNNKVKAYLEYAIFGKFTAGPASFSIGFQGATDGRYYIAGNVKF